MQMKNLKIITKAIHTLEVTVNSQECVELFEATVTDKSELT